MVIVAHYTQSIKALSSGGAYHGFFMILALPARIRFMRALVNIRQIEYSPPRGAVVSAKVRCLNTDRCKLLGRAGQ